MARAKKRKKPTEDIEKCAICLDEKDVKTMVKLNRCRHVYCVECIEKWCERENTCPQCKQRINFLTIPGRNRRKRVRHANLNEDVESSIPEMVNFALMNYVASRNFRRSLAETVITEPTGPIMMIWDIVQRALPALNRQIRRDIYDDVSNLTDLSLDVFEATDAMLRLRRTSTSSSRL